MSTPPPSPPPAKKKAPRKRTRDTSLITIVNDRFLCSWTLEAREKMIITPAIGKVPSNCFVNLPCAVAWLRHMGASDEDITKHVLGDQQLEQVPMLPQDERNRLRVFTEGGDTFYDWMPNALEWDQHTEQAGTTVTEFRAAQKTPKKKAKPAPIKMQFEPGMHLIPFNRLPGKGIVADSVDDPCHKLVSRVAEYARKHEGMELTTASGKTRRLVLIGSLPGEFDVIDPSHRNVIASQLLGADMYGPVVLTTSTPFSFVLK